MDDPACDPKLMPAFPGLADVNNCRDWKPGVPVNLDKIRPKDEQYWNEHRGHTQGFHHAGGRPRGCGATSTGI